MKKGILIVVALLLVSCMATVGQADGYKFAFSGSELANPWVVMVKNGFDDACKELNIECISLNAESDAEKQIQNVEDVISGGYNALIFNPIDGDAMTNVLNKATEDGIVTITIAQTAKASTAAIALDDYAYGQIIAQNAVDWINKNLGGVATIAVLAEDNIESSIARGDAIVDTLTAGLPNSTIVARQHANTPELGLSVTENLLLQYPDINIIVCCNDSGGVGAYQAMVNEGKVGDNYGIFSGDKTDEAVALMLKEGTIYRGTADLVPYQSGYNAVKMAYKFLTEGIPKEQYVEPMFMAPITLEDLLAEGK
jgi:ribose transport system substrate-binding protein